MTEVRISSIIMPPPAPTKPQIMPMNAPQIIDCTARFFLLTFCMASCVVITGRMMNLMPSSIVISTLKLPIVRLGTRLAT